MHYDPATGLFVRLVSHNNRVKAGQLAGGRHCMGYTSISVDCRRYLAHRLAWLYVYGCWPSGMLDHIDGDRLNNRIDNLRDCGQVINQQNRKRADRDSRSGLLGVQFHAETGKWRARIGIGSGRVRSLGLHDTPEAAYAAYLAAKRVLHAGNTL